MRRSFKKQLQVAPAKNTRQAGSKPVNKSGSTAQKRAPKPNSSSQKPKP